MELDYQVALLLQHKFEREHRDKKSAELSDKLLAKLLQEEFEKESKVTGATRPSLIPPEDNKVGKLLNSSKCLTDPSWELNDPTPDIHLLFVVFSKKFFWDKLGSVSVSWSKRMTTCAGICSYSGRGGMCVITLSEPLLKLRPRKDLVETLLHEMIHAFLFITNNNRDRDGHGPEFHKHMSRINKEAGTNITVYHSFHEEVRLYQQHWWRCDGPCQHRGPYFGMVRRVTNRAPGQYDRWWDEHSRTCGGAFIKVREPEKKFKGKTPIPAKPVNNIKNYFGSTNGQASGSNIKTFKDLGGSATKGRPNSSSTIVTTRDSPQDNTYKPTQINNIAGNATKDFKKPSQINKPTTITTSQNSTNDFINVRSHWQNKFTDGTKPSTSTSASKRSSENVCPRSSKLQKTVSLDDKEPDDVKCPVCGKKVLIEKLNEHLDVCLETSGPIPITPSEELKKCEICNEQVRRSEFDQHAEQCLLKLYDGTEKEVEVSCLACGKQIKRQDLNAHLDECMVNIFNDKKGDNVEEKVDDQFNCPFCMKLVDEVDMKGHIDVCLKSSNLDEFLE